MGSVSSTITLVDQMSGALAGIESSINSMKNTLQSVAGEQTSIDNFKWDKFIQGADDASKKITKIGQEMTLALTAPLVMLGKEMYGDAVEYESAFAGVTKTVTGTKEEYDALYSDLLKLSERNPTGFTEAAGVMEMAGQLGVAKEELTGFTESYIKLQESTNILGEEGAEDLARFLNLTEKTSSNIERIGGVIVGLGNNNATTEREILSMATRIGATGDLAGFSAKEILALSAALSSVGINAEAGGSAAGKLMKKMQLAAEIGGTAQEKIKDIHWTETDKTTGQSTEVWLKDLAQNGLDFVNYLDTLKSADKVDIASKLGMTTETLQNMADSWLLFDQFSEVMGITGEDFLSGWKDSPAQSMLKFFQGLGNLGQEGGESVLAKLAEMDITEIRLSNLVAAMAGNSELLQAALEEAYRQYDMNPENNAMNEEVAKRYETTESKNEMLKNKLHNTFADFGENLIEALQPVLEMVNNILDAFNNLSETDQSNILKGLAVIAALGPGLTIVGGALKAIAAAMKLISGHGKGAAEAVKSVMDASNDANPTGAAADAAANAANATNAANAASAAGAAAGKAAEGANAANAAAANAAGGAADAGLSVGSKIAGGVALAAVAYLFSKGIEYRNEHGAIGSAEAIQRATQDNEALRNAFVEWVAVNNELNQAAEDVMNGKMGEEQFAEIAERQQKAIESFLGMEGSEVVKDLYNDWRTINNMSLLDDWYLPEDFLNWLKSFETPETPETPKVDIPEPEVNVPQVETPEIDVPQPNVNVPETPQVEIPEPEIVLPDDVSDIQIPVIPEFHVEGDIDTLTKQFAEQFGITDPIVIESLLSLGITPSDITGGTDLTSGVTEQLQNTEGVTNAANSLGSSAVTAANEAMSPENFVVGAGFGLGISQTIQAESSSVSIAASEMGGGAASGAEGAMGSGVGSGIGAAFAGGLAAGILGGRSAVVAAAVAVATAAAAAAKGALGIASPSKVTYWQGTMMIQGYVNALTKGSSMVNKAVLKVTEGASKSWKKGVWDTISSFSDLEAQALEDKFNYVKDGTKVNETDIKRIRQLAEREVINHFTTAEVKVEMNNTNNINKELDIDGVISQLEDKLTERLEAVAEGVYT